MTDAGTQEQAGDEQSTNLVNQLVDKLRNRLLDLTTRNPLLAFKHGAKTPRFVRVVDEVPNFLFDRLDRSEADTAWKFKSLGEQDEELEDEKTTVFRRAMDAARLEDKEYLEQLDALGDDPGEKQLEKVESHLRTRVRERLGLPDRSSRRPADITEVAKRRGVDPSYDLPSSSTSEARHSDAFVQTLMYESKMQTVLSGIREKVAIASSEMGVNPLFCVFGFLEWYEADESETPLHAPLLLYPLSLTRDLVRGSFQYGVQSSGEGAQMNVALAARMKRDFGLEIPDVGDETTPDSYMADIQSRVQGRKGWRVRRWVTVGLFSFARIAMYEDLAKDRWGGQSFSDHNIVRRLLTGDSRNNTTCGSSDQEEDSSGSEFTTPLIYDADSTQLAALRDTSEGRNLVIEGPPGTGKSQTIANIIAASLADGKSVLFLAEKMAALRVVKSRLDAAGLGEYCLELHSTKVGRREVLRQISARLEKQKVHAPVHDARAVAADLDQLQEQLGTFAQALSKPAASLGVSVHSLIWQTTSLRRLTAGAPADIDDIEAPAALDMTTTDVSRIASDADALQSLIRSIKGQYGTVSQHPWSGVASAGMGIMQCQECVRAMSRISRAARDAIDASRTIRTKTGQDIQYLGELRRISTATQLPTPGPHLDPGCLARIATPNSAQIMRDFLRDLDQRDRLAATLQQYIASDIDAQPPVAVLRQIEESLASLGAPAPKSSLDLDGLIESQRLRATQLQKCSQLAAALKAVVGHEPDAALLSRLRAAVAVAAEASDTLLIYRSDPLQEAGAAAILRSHMTRQQALIQIRESLKNQFGLALAINTSTLRAHAQALRRGGLFARLNKAWRAARAAFRSLYVGDRRMPPRDMAKSMDALCDYVDEVHAFASSAELRRLTGNGFTGWDTDLEPFLKTAEWLSNIRSHFQGLFAHVLAFGSPSIVKSLAGLGNHPGMSCLDIVAEKDLQHLPTAITSSDSRLQGLEQAKDLLTRSGLRPNVALADVPHILEVATKVDKLNASLASHQAAHEILGSAFKGPQTDRSNLQEYLEWVDAVQATGLPKHIQSWLFGGQLAERCRILRSLSADVEQANAGIQAAISSLTKLANVRFREWLGAESVDDVVLLDLADATAKCATLPDELSQLVEHEDLLGRMAAVGLAGVPKLCDAESKSVTYGAACRRVILQSIVRSIVAREPALAGFSGMAHEGKRDKFRSLDRKLMGLRRTLISASIMQRQVHQGRSTGLRSEWTGLALVSNEVSKQRRFISVRDLLGRAGKAVQDLMPCFMMSPISVAQYLPSRGLSFDLVVMDEASQLRPEDALGAIVRGKQVVIVGDPKQLPPTSFFLGSGREESAYSEDLDMEVEESILDTALTTMGKSRLLRWHYRSRHESLISFSNREFYEGKLVLFPSPHGGSGFGVHYQRVPDGCYSGGTNPQEAREVASKVLECSRSQPDRTLGVVALNQRQAELINLEVDRIAIEHPEFEAWRNSKDKDLEPFFVKNLENVQGDERDTIIISTVYGRDANGNMYQRFGPINTQGGHRRLNVLFTRAKFSIILVTSMGPEDIAVSDTSSLGVKALKRYLAFARDGATNIAEESSGSEESPFETEVAEFLRTEGYEVASQVGVAGYRIDLAVRRPGSQGGFVLGIECDGSSYHSSRSARDRDRLRQEHLERLNWKIHRIWSLDWFSRPRRECEKLLDRVKKALAE